MPVQIKTDKQTHPFTSFWARVQNVMNSKRAEIQTATGWSNSTFYRKVQQGLKNKLVLSEAEKTKLEPIIKTDLQNLFNTTNLNQHYV